MSEVMYEINWHNTYTRDRDGVFTHCTVTPITILRRGIQPGATRETITGRDGNGRRFTGNPKDYYKTSEEAWSAVKEDILRLQADIAAMKEFLKVAGDYDHGANS
jgi:hypothetical protein